MRGSTAYTLLQYDVKSNVNLLTSIAQSSHVLPYLVHNTQGLREAKQQPHLWFALQ